MRYTVCAPHEQQFCRDDKIITRFLRPWYRNGLLPMGTNGLGRCFFTIDIYCVFAEYLDREMEGVKTRYFVVKPNGKGSNGNRPVSCNTARYYCTWNKYIPNTTKIIIIILSRSFLSGTLSLLFYYDDQ